MILIEKKKNALLIAVSLTLLHNFYAILSIINSFRRDYNYDITNFPLFSSLLYFIFYNAVLLTIIVVITLNFKLFNENQLVRKIRAILRKISSIFFNPETMLQKILSFILLLFFFYILAFLSTLIHEFGHGIAKIICGGYYDKININLFLGGAAYTVGGSYTTQCSILTFLAGLLAEIIFGLILLIILISMKTRNKFRKFSILNVLTAFLINGIGYFTIYSLLDTHSDARTLANILNIHPIAIFLITLPFLIGIISYSLFNLWKFYKNFFKPNKFFPCIYFICIIILYWYKIFFSLVINPYDLPFLTIV